MDYQALEKLAKRAAKGDIGALEELCRQKTKTILYHSLKQLGNRQDAEDAMQEILLRICRNIGTLKDPAMFNAWLMRIVRNTCTEIGVRRKRYDEKHDNVVDFENKLIEKRAEFLPYEAAEESYKKELLKRVISELPEKRRAAILMYYYDGMSCKEIGVAMGIQENSVGSTILRARETIGRRLEYYMGEAETRKTRKQRMMKEAEISAFLPVVLAEEAETIFTYGDFRIWDTFVKNAVDDTRKTVFRAVEKKSFAKAALKLACAGAVTTAVVFGGAALLYEEPQISAVDQAPPVIQQVAEDAEPPPANPQVETSTVILPAYATAAPDTRKAPAVIKDKIAIKMAGELCECGHRNPTQAVLTGEDIGSSEEETKWIITEEGADPEEEGAVLYEGTGYSVTDEFAEMREKDEKGNYTLTYTLLDKKGKEIKASRTFLLEDE